jgi:2-methylcitrate dehydratase PrpD
MDASYARLSAPYVAARALLTGDVGREAFTAEAYRHGATQDLARRIDIAVVDADANALTPVEVAIELCNGARCAARIDVVYGNPAKPIDAADRVAKFCRNCAAALAPPPPGAAEGIIAGVARLEDLEDVGELFAPALR